MKGNNMKYYVAPDGSVHFDTKSAQSWTDYAKDLNTK